MSEKVEFKRFYDSLSIRGEGENIEKGHKMNLDKVFLSGTK